MSVRGDEAYVAALVEQSPEAALVVRAGRILFVNGRGAALLGVASAPPEPEPAREPWSFVPVADRPAVQARHRSLEATPSAAPVTSDDTLLTASGEAVPVSTVSSRVEIDGAPAVLVTARTPDLTPDRSTNDRFVEAFRVAPTGMLLLDADGIVLDANAAAAELTGVPREQLLGRPSLRLLHPEDRALVRSWIAGLLRGPATSTSGERRLLRSDSVVTWAHLSMALLPGDPPGFVVHLIDVTERRETEAQFAHQALHDSLTGLPNRTLLFDRLAHAVHVAQRGGPGVTVLYIDIDNFKTINDTRGHAVGDLVLSEVATRLLRVLRPADTVARLGGDEFAVVAEGLPEDAAADLAGRVAEAIRPAVGLSDGQSLEVVASVGMAHSSSVPLDVDLLLSAADAAMYRAKQQSRERGRR